MRNRSSSGRELARRLVISQARAEPNSTPASDGKNAAHQVGSRMSTPGKSRGNRGLASAPRQSMDPPRVRPTCERVVVKEAHPSNAVMPTTMETSARGCAKGLPTAAVASCWPYPITSSTVPTGPNTAHSKFSARSRLASGKFLGMDP